MSPAAFRNWVDTLLALCESRGITIALRWHGASSISFDWHCLSGGYRGSGGMTAAIAALTPPGAFMWLWRCEPSQRQTRESSSTRETWARAGRVAPRVPAMATSDALNTFL